MQQAEVAVQNAKVIARYMASLTPKELSIVSNYYGLNGCQKQTQMEMAATQGVTPRRSKRSLPGRWPRSKLPSVRRVSAGFKVVDPS
jgi:hypothetical protein